MRREQLDTNLVLVMIQASGPKPTTGIGHELFTHLLNLTQISCRKCCCIFDVSLCFHISHSILIGFVQFNTNFVR